MPALLREQAGWCEVLGSPLYATLLRAGADDLESGGPVYEVLAGHEHDRAGSALALRLMGAVHRLVLEGCAPRLAAFYPSAGGDAARDGAWEAFREVVAHHTARVRSLVDAPVQTNEVGRCAALIGGFLTIARETALPLALLEIGASAGLNLRWDGFRYEAGGSAFGDPASPVRMRDVFVGPEPRLDVTVTIVSRRGCDRAPLDPTRLEDRLTLESYLWPDQTERMALLRAAFAVARRFPLTVERADLGDWLAAALASPTTGAATVVFHSIVLQYLTRAERERLRATSSAGRVRPARRSPGFVSSRRRGSCRSRFG